MSFSITWPLGAISPLHHQELETGNDTGGLPKRRSGLHSLKSKIGLLDWLTRPNIRRIVRLFLLQSLLDILIPVTGSIAIFTANPQTITARLPHPFNHQRSPYQQSEYLTRLTSIDPPILVEG